MLPAEEPDLPRRPRQPIDRLSVAVVEDEPPLRKALEDIIASEHGMCLSFSAQTVREAMSSAQSNPAQIYLVDLGLPDASGMEFIAWQRRNQPDALSMVLTVFGDDEHIFNSFGAGAMGYLLKDSSPEEIVLQLNKLAQGGSPISPSVARRMLQHFMPGMLSRAAALTELPKPLSAREHEVLCLIEKGFTYEEIGQFLGITWHTVTGYLRRVYRKLEVNSRGEAVFEARQRGLI